MMPDFLLAKSEKGFIPADEKAEKIFHAMSHGELCKAEYKKNRNYENHKRYFAFIQKTFDMQEKYDNVEIWRKVIEMQAGHFDEMIMPSGKLVYYPKSIEYEKLDEIEFNEIFSNCVDSSLKILPEINGNDLSEKELLEIIGFV